MTLVTTMAKGALGSLHKRGPYDGAKLPAQPLTLPEAHIDARRLAAYADVCGFPRTDRLPPTYPHVLGFPLAMRLMAQPAFPFPLLGLVHTGIELTRWRALHAGDRPTLTVHAEGLAPHRRGSAFRLVTTALLDGEEVWSSRSTYLCRHPVPDGGTDRQREGTGTGTADPLSERTEWRLPGDLGRRYAAVSGDRNPIHLYALTAKAFGFPRALAHGMWTFARCLARSAALREQTGEPEHLTAEARFLSPVLLPGTVVHGQRDGAFELRDGRDRDRLHLSGTVSSGPPS